MPRPTILVGHGDFGRDALQRLLATAAPRGVLPWTRRPQGGAGAGERQLRDLVLLWIPERPGPAGGPGGPGAPTRHLPDPAAAGTTPEFLQDLYRQILAVGPEGEVATPGQALGAAVDEAKRSLLSPPARQERGGAQGAMHGLDLVFLARPETATALGQIDNLLGATLRPLREDPTLRRVGTGAQIVNCIALLDFDDFWARGDEARRLRRALANSAQTWEGRQGERAGPGRIYLLDSKTAGAQRDRDARLDEATLFLELLLFEGQRSELDWLYRQPSHGQPVLAAFGIRLLERSPALLGAIAAARFGQDWLPYLAGDKPPNPAAIRVRRALAPLREGDPSAPGGADPLFACWRAGVEEVVAAVMALPNREAPDWAERARDSFRRHGRALELELARTGDALAGDLRRCTRDQGEAVRGAIEADLHDDREPVPLASIEAELDATLADLAAARGAARRSPVTAGPVGLEEMHGRFLAQAREWIGRQGRALRPFRWLLGVLLGLGLAPFAQAFLLSLPEPDPLAPLHRLYQGAQWFTHPAPLALVLAALATWLLTWPLGRGVRRRIARARDFYLDPNTGRFVALIRAQDDPLTLYLDQARANLAANRAAEALQGLGQVRERLAERGREMRWLRTQLGEFLRLHGQHPDPSGTQGQPRRPQLSVRQWVEEPGDLERMLQTNPLTEERLRARQEDLPAPFQGWDARYCDAFLDPLAFVARLGHTYVRPFENALLEPDSREQALRQSALLALLKRPDFSLAFAFAATDATPTSHRYCVIPPAWLLHAPARRTLDEQGGVNEAATLEGRDPTRVYLFEVVTGVPASCLED